MRTEIIANDEDIKSLRTDITALLRLSINNIMTDAVCRFQDAHISAISYSGKPGATSQFADNHGPQYAFKPEGVAPYATSGSGKAETVWYEFIEPQIVAKISLRSRKGASWNTAPQASEDLTFKGSDDCQTWVTLKSVAHAGFTKNNETRAFVIPCKARRAYKCYGIGVKKAHGGKAEKHVSLANVVMYG